MGELAKKRGRPSSLSERARQSVLPGVWEIKVAPDIWALVDAADAERISQFPWYLTRPNGRRRGYVETKKRRDDGSFACISMHRFILDAPPDKQVDHINGDGLDNRRINLRLCSVAENVRNRRAEPGHFKGVQPRKYGRYRAVIRINYETRYSKNFATREEAARAYDEMARVLHGDFANLNFPNEEE